MIDTIVEYLNEELATADSARQAEIERLLTVYRFLPRRPYGREDVIIPSALVELQLGETHAFYFIAPQGGGLITNVGGRPVQVITPQSPLGEVLLGKKVGDEVKVEIRVNTREYRVISLV